MKIGLKNLIAILLFCLVDLIAGYILYTKPWTKISGKNVQPTQVIKPTLPKQQNVSLKTYSNADMHISFGYSPTLELTMTRPHLISIRDPFTTSSDSTLYIFETTIINGTKTVDIPFVIKGKLTKETPVPIHNFTAKQLVYMDGKSETDFLTLQNKQQFIMVRLPKDSTDVEDAITDFVDTVKTVQ